MALEPLAPVAAATQALTTCSLPSEILGDAPGSYPACGMSLQLHIPPAAAALRIATAGAALKTSAAIRRTADT